MEFKDKVRLNREKLGYTLEELAKLVGVSAPTIQRYESGEIKNVRRDKISKLSKALEVSPSYLMGWDEDLEESNHKNLLTRTDKGTNSSNSKDSKTSIPPDYFTSPQEAVDFLLNQNVIMGFNGLDITKLSEDEQLEYANEILNQIKLVSYKYKD